MLLLKQAKRVVLCGAIALALALALASATSKADTVSLQQLFQQAEVDRIVHETQLRGDPARGAIVFYTSAAACATCHGSGEGISPLGPDLSKLGVSATPAHLVESLLYPSKVIRDGYQTVQLLTADGRLQSGMVASETEVAIVLRDAANLLEEVSIAKDDIEVRSNSTVSMMPEGLVSSLKSQAEFLDLMSYLFAIQAGGPSRAEELKPSPEQLVPRDDTANLDHAKIIEQVERGKLKRGAQIYESSCVQCHGADGNKPSLSTARAFGTQKVKFGADPYSMFLTLSHGNGLMRAASDLSPRERYEVVAYIRDRFMKGSNPDYQPVSKEYLRTLPTGTEMGETQVDPDRDYGPALASQLGRDVGSAFTIGLGDVSISYNLHTLDQAAIWSGGFLDVDQTQHKRGRGEGYPKPRGKLIEALSLWRWGHDGKLDYPEEDLLPRGPLPKRWLDYHGHYLYGDQVVLSHAIDGREVLEVPSSIKGETAVRHTLQITGGNSLVLAAGYAEQGSERPSLLGDIDGVTVKKDSKNRWVVQIPAGEKTRTIDVIRQTEPLDSRQLEDLTAINPREMIQGGKQNWPQTFETIGYVGFQSGAYAVDTISIPESTPWNTWFRTSAIDFFEDGRLAVATVGGDVWIVSGIDNDLLNIQWKRFAGGMFEPFGIKVVDGLVYVTCRDRLTRLHDLDEDGEADFYESFSADTDVSTYFHAFNFDLQTDSQGNFYYAKSGQYTDFKLPGAIIKVSADGKTRDVVCTGLRTPNGMGILPSGQLTVSDNQGNWMPASKVSLVEQDGFYGYVQNRQGRVWAPDGGKIDVKKVVPPETFDQPVIWLPQEIDNSSGGQVFVDDERFGPLSRRLLHTSFGQGNLFYLMVQEVDGVSQAALVKFHHDFNNGIMRGRVNPTDGQLYVCGLNGWNDNGRAGLTDGGIERVRYTGKPTRMVADCKVANGELRISFNFALDPRSATELISYKALQWNYQWTGNYGSDAFHPETGEVGKQELLIDSVTLSPDGKSLTLHVPQLRPVNQLHLSVNVNDTAGESFAEEVYWTIHRIP